jgi:hypothetical protein
MLDEDNGVIYFSTKPGFTIDGGENFSLCNGIPNDEQLRHIVQTGTNLIGATINTSVYGGSILKSIDNGINWTINTSFSGRLLGLFFTNSTYIVQETFGVATNPNNNILISLDAINWSTQTFNNNNSPIPIGANTNELIVQTKEYTGTPNEYKIWFHFYSTSTQQWDSLDFFQSITRPYTTQIGAIAFKNNIGVVLLNNREIYVSLDGGHNWTQKTSLPNPLDFNYSAFIKIDSQNHIVVWGRYSSGVVHPILVETTDGGITWINNLNLFEEPYMSGVNINDVHFFNLNEAIATSSASVSNNPYDYIWKKSNPVSLLDYYSEPNISIFPNPNNGQFTLTNIKEETTITIQNSYGQIIQSYENIGSSTLEVNIDMPAGFYFIRISNKNETQVHKVVIN